MNSNEQCLSINYIDKLILSTKHAISDLELSLIHLNNLKVNINNSTTTSHIPSPIAHSEPESKRPEQEPSLLIRMKDLTKITGLSRSTIYKLSSNGDFPQKVQLSSHSVAWLRADIEKWINDRVTNLPR